MKKIITFFKKLFKKTLRYILKPLSFLPAIILMFIIFNFSAQDGVTSGSLSYAVSLKLVNFYNNHMDKGYDAAQVLFLADYIHLYVRKAAHITEYFLLGISVALPLYVYRVRGIWLILTAGLFCTAFAGLDEYHQSFVDGRGASARDVAIDCIGIFPGIIVSQIIGFIGRKTIFAPLSLEKERKAKAAWEKKQKKRGA